MVEMDILSWEEPLTHRMKLERNLNFSTISNEEDEFGFSRKKTARDPMSHRIIEKRRRDRMNNCLADLSRLVPTNYLKKGRGRIEKTEIIEMAIKHLKHLQAHPCKDPANCEVAKATELDHKRQYRIGYQECMSETVRFMVESEGLFSGDAVCVRLINHLQKHYDKVSGGMCYTQALGMIEADESKPTLHMDVDSASSFPPDMHRPDSVHTSPDRLSSSYPYDVTPILPPELKQEEIDIPPLSSTNQQDAATPPPKPTSQLREMLQNPGLPKDRSSSNSSSRAAAPVASPQPSASCKGDEVYKFKNNIKHRFNADLRHHAASPTDSQPDDDRRATYPALPAASSAHWDSHSSSCGSPPPPTRSNGSNSSSSGYSTHSEQSKPPVGKPMSPYHPMSPPGMDRGVPVFAFHPKGGFYVPLTLDAAIMTPYLMEGDAEVTPTLHPISIYVNFALAAKVGDYQQQHQQRQYLMDKFHEQQQQQLHHHHHHHERPYAHPEAFLAAVYGPRSGCS